MYVGRDTLLIILHGHALTRTHMDTHISKVHVYTDWRDTYTYTHTCIRCKGTDMYMNTYVHTHTYIHKYGTYSCTQVRVHAHERSTHKRTQVQVHVHAYAHTYTDKWIRTHDRIYEIHSCFLLIGMGGGSELPVCLFCLFVCLLFHQLRFWWEKFVYLCICEKNVWLFMFLLLLLFRLMFLFVCFVI